MPVSGVSGSGSLTLQDVMGANGWLDDVQGSQSAAPTYDRTNVTSAGKELTMTDFYTLLAAQLKYQDADNPMDTAEMMGQMVQTQMIQAITTMTSNNTTTYAASMVGKNVTVEEVDEKGRKTMETTSGTVTGVVLGTDPTIFINGKGYKISQVSAIGETNVTAAKPDEATKPNEAGKTV